MGSSASEATSDAASSSVGSANSGDGVSASWSKTKKHRSPQDEIDAFWKKFNSKTPGRAFNILPKNDDTQRPGEKPLRDTSKAKPAASSYEEAAVTCKSKVETIIKECRRVNQKYRDVHFDIEFDLKWGIGDCTTMLGNTTDVESEFSPGSVKRVGDIFEKPEFYKSGATASDIRQGRDGDCWLMAALGTLGNKSGLIEKVCVMKDEQIGVYGFVFYRDGEWISEIIDDKLYLTKPDYDESWAERNDIEDRQRVNSEEDYRKIYQTGSGALYFAQCEDENETWLPLLEKAYAKAHGDYAAINGGFTGEALEDLTGGVTTEIFTTDILDRDLFWRELLQVNKEFLFGCAASTFRGRGDRKGIVEGHAYSILKAVEVDGKRLCLLRNPWGIFEWNGPWSDGSKEWTPEWMQKLDHRFGNDGTFWMSYEDLLRKYQTFDRTRLFVDDWEVTQQWTSFNVSWASDYHSTKFSFSAEKKTSFVLVLSQLDDRYFRGLEGQYRFELSFRVHKAGEEDYIVRSHGNYCMRRSVTAELELEPGEYHVLVKIEAERFESSLPIEDVLRNNAKLRRDKLLRIGRAYDLAHAKGQITESSEEKTGREKLEAREKEKEKNEMKDKLTKEKKRRKHVDNKELRKTREATAKHKAKEKAKEARKKERREAKEAKKKEKREARKKQQKEAKAARKREQQEAKKANQDTENQQDIKITDEAKEGDKVEVEKAKDEESHAVEPSPPEIPPLSETKLENNKVDDSVIAEHPASEDTEKPPLDEKVQGSDTPTENGSENLKGTIETTLPIEGDASPVPEADAPKVASEEDEEDEEKDDYDDDDDSDYNDYSKYSDSNCYSEDSDDSDDDDDQSDINSVVSDVTSGVVEEAIEKDAPPQTVASEATDDEDDEFVKNPWNAVAIVGLRIYSKGSPVSISVVRPKFWEGLDKESISKSEKFESKLDVDDSAVDGATGQQKEKDVKPEVGTSEPEEAATKTGEIEGKKVVSDEANKSEEGSERSVVIV